MPIQMCPAVASKQGRSARRLTARGAAARARIEATSLVRERGVAGTTLGSLVSERADRSDSASLERAPNGRGRGQGSGGQPKTITANLDPARTLDIGRRSRVCEVSRISESATDRK
ncbi:hypothetical protein MPRM_10210 [Mycobacterium parmense]|uniref:Uncharacterized protein n=1 Tax=Mycobacterium parmense TaxID=185642 RepID=A0A7I7YPQ4_9MYCO|nr:hypothetical protein MPRM_10210 [Mycobacterium parmense]